MAQLTNDEIKKSLMESIHNKTIVLKNTNYKRKPRIEHEKHNLLVRELECKNGMIQYILYCKDCSNSPGPLRIAQISKIDASKFKSCDVEYDAIVKRPEAIVYRWVDKKTNKQYIGSHELSPKEPFEGTTRLVKEGIWLPGPHGLKNIYAVAFFVKKQYPDAHTGYVCSSKNLLVQMKLRPTDFTREVLATGSTYKMRKLETKLLQEINVADNPNYYNKHNNNKIENCMKFHRIYVCQEPNEKFSLGCYYCLKDNKDYKLSDITLEEAYVLEQEGYPSLPDTRSVIVIDTALRKFLKNNKVHKSWSNY